MPRTFATPTSSAPAPRRPRRARRLLAACVLAGAAVAPSAQAQFEPFIGQLMLVGYNFCPRGWAAADGSLLSIAQNTALFSLLGTQFGGDGRVTFALPDLRGRAPIGVGQGPGLQQVLEGQTGGSENVTLLQQHMPVHTHALNASPQAATHAAPAADRLLATAQNAGTYVAAGPGVPLAPNSVGAAGGSQPFSVRDPYLGMRWCIALQGVFPSRN